MTAKPEQVQGRHLRAARTLLTWTKAQAAEECGVGVNTIGRFEDGSSGLTPRTVADIVRAFEANGVMFITTDFGSGVVLKQEADAE
ncbi:helix-turn-helix domain-containing protein [Devosia aurantiaca]|uniref:Helix-turn-helix domain-containing protein n=1 Tax=Devosia aurantiaca TaxID=2714858 RepID=A0A6M1SLX2_9HYPH|nr:helix-turn-helix transcriptional regulator [Devosia aurantiaca]NGP16532.1 helix-turn-helix domain-containing protein [Devosia aurantiaca]